MFSPKEIKKGRKREKDFDVKSPNKDRASKTSRRIYDTSPPLKESRTAILAAIERSGLLKFPKKDGRVSRPVRHDP